MRAAGDYDIDMTVLDRLRTANPYGVKPYAWNGGYGLSLKYQVTTRLNLRSELSLADVQKRGYKFDCVRHHAVFRTEASLRGPHEVFLIAFYTAANSSGCRV